MGSDSDDSSTYRSGFWKVASVCAAVYFLQGISEPTEGLVGQPINAWFRRAGHGAEWLGWYGALISIPWIAKPLYGLITDRVPLFGNRRKSYLVAAHSVTGAAMLVLYLGNAWWQARLDSVGLLLCLGAAAVGVAFADVVIDAVMVEAGQRWKSTGRLQSIQWTSLYAATIVAGLVGGELSQLSQQSVGFLASVACAVLGILLAMRFITEPPRTANSNESSNQEPSPVPTRGSMWLRYLVPAAVFVFLWNFSPFTNSVLYMHMTSGLGWPETAYGQNIAWQAVGSMAGSLLYGSYCRRLSMRGLIHLAVLSGVAGTGLYWFLDSPSASWWVGMGMGLTFMTGSMVQMDYAARVVPVQWAGTSFALLMALANLSLTLASGWGGTLYGRWSNSLGMQRAFHSVLLVGMVTTAACWLLLPWLHEPEGKATASGLHHIDRQEGPFQ